MKLSNLQLQGINLSDKNIAYITKTNIVCIGNDKLPYSISIDSKTYESVVNCVKVIGIETFENLYGCNILTLNDQSYIFVDFKHSFNTKTKQVDVYEIDINGIKHENNWYIPDWSKYY